ncbi:unnamed protein product [Lupinus luteus]|uniref:Uncharacterized protein n=1 Tax=Lupinus luteus TaxID=3873 RepID=A0AAV1XNI0_LUPLU
MNQPSFLTQESYSGFDYSIEEHTPQEETHAVISEIFKGFLTIGTLGAETVTNEPGTPTFSMPLENMHAEVTENELKLISHELEKFLVAEKEESYYESSRRNSYVSIVTLSDEKLIDGSEAEDYGNRSLCPLQGYLLGSSVELKEKREVRKERVSLAELFNRTKTITATRDSIEMKKTHKSAIQIMKKMLKKVNGSSKSTNISGDDAVSSSTNKKLQKVLGMFHRKVYPENTMKAKDFIKSHKGKNKSVPDEYDNGDLTNLEKSRVHSDAKPRKWSQQCKSNCKSLQHGISCSSSIGNNEHWIKTDANCKYYTPSILNWSCGHDYGYGCGYCNCGIVVIAMRIAAIAVLIIL